MYVKEFFIKNVIDSSFRKKRFNHFISHLEISDSTQILDIGGIENTWIGSKLEKYVTLVNIIHYGDNNIKKIYGDARELSMFENKSVDFVFSNSVIEHVGNYEEQKKMASEIIRIAKKYWVQTPNKNFPIEIHFLFPFFQFLPKKIQKFVAKFWPFSLARIFHLDPINELDNLFLLNKKQIQHLFPDSTILNENLFFLTKSFIITNIHEQ